MAKRPGVERVLVVPDIHVPNHDLSALRVLKEFCDDWKPNTTIFLGDLIDADAVSQLPPYNARIPQLEEYEQAKEILDVFKPDILLEGNHEERVTKRFIREDPSALRGRGRQHAQRRGRLLASPRDIRTGARAVAGAETRVGAVCPA